MLFDNEKVSRAKLREGCTRVKAEAHTVLDLVAVGYDVPRATIARALAMLGDA